MTDKPDEGRKEVVAIDIEAVHPDSPRNYPVVTVHHPEPLEGVLVDNEPCPVCGHPLCPFSNGISLYEMLRASSEELKMRFADFTYTAKAPPEDLTPEQRTVWKARRYADNYGMGAGRMRAIAESNIGFGEPVIASGFGRATAAMGVLGMSFDSLARAINVGSMQILKERTGDSGFGFYSWDSQAFSLKDLIGEKIAARADDESGWKRKTIPKGKELPARRAEPLLLDNSPRSLGDLFNVARVDRQYRRKKRK